MKINTYTNSAVVQRYCKETNIDSKVADEHFTALKNFLLLCSKTNKPCFPSKELDEIWHTFILFTRDYYTFCLDGLGKFIHHIPFNSEVDKIENFKPGYFCFIKGKKMEKIYVVNLTQLESSCKTNCGSGGDCSSCSSCRDQK